MKTFLMAVLGILVVGFACYQAYQLIIAIKERRKKKKDSNKTIKK